MGKYSLILVFALMLSIFAYRYGIMNTNWMSEVRKAEVFNRGQAKNIAQSVAQVVVAKIMNPDDVQFNPPSNTTYYFPQNQGEFEHWLPLEGKYRIAVTNYADTLFRVQTVGLVSNTTYEVQVELKPSTGSSAWNPEFPTAVFTQGTFELTGSARILGSAGTNSIAPASVVLNSWAWPNSVEHTLFIGPGGDPSIVISSTNNNSVGGQVQVLSTARNYPMPDFPATPSSSSTRMPVSLSGSQSLTLLPADFVDMYIPSINIESNTNLTINIGAGEYVMHVGDLNISQGHIHLTGTGSLTIFVTGNMTMGGSSSLNLNGGVDQLFMYYKGTQALNFTGSTTFNGGIFAETASITLGGSNSISGHLITGGSSVVISGAAQAHSRVIFAPNAFVDMSGSGQVTGAIVADRFRAVGNTRVFFNQVFNNDLPNLSVTTGGTQNSFTVLSWN